jgi:hypothetical protein
MKTLRARQGDTFHTTLRLSQNGTPLNLTGADVEFAFAPTPGGAPAYQYDEAPEAAITNPTQGEIQLNLDYDLTRTITARNWFYEVTLTFPNDTRKTILSGFLIVEQEIVE